MSLRELFSCLKGMLLVINGNCDKYVQLESHFQDQIFFILSNMVEIHVVKAIYYEGS